MQRHLNAPIRTVMASVVVAAGLVAGPARAAQAATAPTLSEFQLRPASNQAELMDRVQLLDAELPTLGVANILAQASRQGTWSSGICNSAAAGQLTQVTRSFCFDPSDNASIGSTTVEWTPQAVTTVADAQDDQDWNGTKPLLVSWTDDDSEAVKGVRVTFIDSATGKYQHVLLVYPFINASGNPSYMSLRTQQDSTGVSLHAGGMAWYGNYLYVADTDRGFRVFDMRYIFDLQSAANGDTTDKLQIGRQNGIYYGHGYRYVMPEVAAWTNVVDRDPAKKCTVNAGSPTFSFVGLDRSGADHLTTGEFCADLNGTAPADDKGRVAGWPVIGTGDSAGQPEVGGDGLWRADSAFRLPIGNIQGAVRDNGVWYLSRSQGSTTSGQLITTNAASGTTGTLTLGGNSTRTVAIGPEDLSFWSSFNGGQNVIWTVTEWPGRRMLYALPQ